VTTQRLLQAKSDGAFSFRPGYLLFAAFAISLCLFLSHWQWQRAQAAQDRHQRFLQQQETPPVPLSDTAAEFQRVIANGHIERLFLLDNQIHQGQVGWHVIALLSNQKRPVLVNLGWTAKAEAKPTLSDFTGVANISGRTKTPETGLMLADAQEDPAWPGVLQQIDIPLLNQHLDTDLFPFVMYADPASTQFIAVEAAPANKYPMHMGYAVQWLLIAIACGVVTVIACRRRDA